MALFLFLIIIICFFFEFQDEEKDKKIQELTAELRVKKRLSALYREQLVAFMKEVEDHNYNISLKVQRTWDNLKKLDAEAKEILHDR